MKNVHRFALALLLAGAAPWQAGADEWPAEPPWAQPGETVLEQLRAGEVLVDDALLEDSGGAARVRAMFWASAPSIWALLGDCEANLKYVAGLRECEVLESTRHQALTRQVVKKHLLAPRMEYRFETWREPPRWVVIRLVDGDLKQMAGSWRLDPLDDEGAVLVSHQIQVQPRLPVPRWMVRKALREDIGDMVACLRALSGGSRDETMHTTDRQRCPSRDE